MRNVNFEKEIKALKDKIELLMTVGNKVEEMNSENLFEMLDQEVHQK